MKLIDTARELFAKPAGEVLKTTVKRDERQIVIDRVIDISEKKYKALKKQAIKHLTYAERQQLGIIKHT